MWKLVILVHCTTLILQGFGQETPSKPEDTWKSLDNPRNRDLFFRTLKAYFSGREFNLRKFPDAFSITNDKLHPIAFSSDPDVSAFADYEEKKNSPIRYLKG
ncbi:hypothetical protein JRQ81_001451 [Phrynocephalus forsythii]|uniref:Uncharacterized protein n=1 Tax=Phrynocephalus forsythii TaxID=171643 RepID=A0A9Q0Y8L5_9SAUR|nr:hypothetical protein JRQ81_001451 [Phrynocephalus forsythii]